MNINKWFGFKIASTGVIGVVVGCVLHDLAEFPATAAALIIIGIGVTFIGLCLFQPQK